MYREVIATFEEFGDRYSLAINLANFGTFLTDLKKFEAANATLNRALDLREALNDRVGVAIVCGHLGHLRREQGQLDEAARLYRDAISIERECRSNRVLGVHCCELALLELRQQRCQAAALLWKEGQDTLKALDDGPDLAECRKAMLETCNDLKIPPLPI